MFRVRTNAVVLATTLLLFVPSARILGADPTKESADLKYLPADTNLVFVIQMGELLASDGFKKLRKEIPEFDKEFGPSFRKEFGFEISNVKTMTFGGDVNSKGPVGVIQLKEPLKPETLLKGISTPRFEGDKNTYKEEKLGKFTIFVPSEKYRETICLVNEKTIVYAKNEELKAVLMREKPAELSAGMAAALKNADLPASVLMVANPNKAVKETKWIPPIPGMDYEKLKDEILVPA